MVQGLLNGLIDIHVHSAPSLFPRNVDDFSLAEAALAAGMKRVVIKAHEGDSSCRAFLVNQRLCSEILVGAIVLNSYVGGLNASAVDCAVRMGARVVWMPTITAANHVRHYGGTGYPQMRCSTGVNPSRGETVLTEHGDIKPEVFEVLEIVRDNGICLATGHLAPEESVLLIKEALRMGLKRIILNHPEAEVTKVDVETQKDLANKGAYIEKAYLWTQGTWRSSSVEALAQTVKEIGVGSCVLSSDLGNLTSSRPVEGFAEYVKELMNVGMRRQDVLVMARDNPAWLLGL